MASDVRLVRLHYISSEKILNNVFKIMSMWECHCYWYTVTVIALHGRVHGWVIESSNSQYL